MNETMQIIQIIIELMIVFIGLYLAFFKSYFSEKGKNLATKEDIKDITKTVETVKNEIIFNTQSRLSLQVEERESLVAFYEQYNHWLSSISSISFVDISRENIKSMPPSIDSAKYDFDIAEGRMHLFVKNEAIDNILYELKVKTMELSYLVRTTLFSLEKNIVDLEFVEQTVETAESSKKLREIFVERNEIVKKYNTEFLKQYKLITPINTELRHHIYIHLKNLIKSNNNRT
jgi:hypothetical protein